MKETEDILNARIESLESQLRERDEEIERLKRRLEIDTCRDGDGNLVPAPANMPDGIAARDYTIRQQQEEIRKLREAHDPWQVKVMRKMGYDV